MSARRPRTARPPAPLRARSGQGGGGGAGRGGAAAAAACSQPPAGPLPRRPCT
jgi:hypothetical protein